MFQGTIHNLDKNIHRGVLRSYMHNQGENGLWSAMISWILRPPNSHLGSRCRLMFSPCEQSLQLSWRMWKLYLPCPGKKGIRSCFLLRSGHWKPGWLDKRMPTPAGRKAKGAPWSDLRDRGWSTTSVTESWNERISRLRIWIVLVVEVVLIVPIFGILSAGVRPESDEAQSASRYVVRSFKFIVGSNLFGSTP